jgi:hypothetical protein
MSILGLVLIIVIIIISSVSISSLLFSSLVVSTLLFDDMGFSKPDRRVQTIIISTLLEELYTPLQDLDR